MHGALSTADVVILWTLFGIGVLSLVLASVSDKVHALLAWFAVGVETRRQGRADVRLTRRIHDRLDDRLGNHYHPHRNVHDVWAYGRHGDERRDT